MHAERTQRADPAVAWLLRDGDPAVRALARRDLLGQAPDPRGALDSPVVRVLAAPPDEGEPPPYRKWTGAHWRLVSLADLGVPEGHPPVVAACDAVLDFWCRPRRLARVAVVAGRARRCASQEGNAVAAACRLGLARDPRVAVLVEHLLRWQWPDGGWNCDLRPEVTHASFHETLPALHGLQRYAAVTGDPDCRAAVRAAAELLLRHDVAFSTRTGRPAHPAFLVPHYPPYWHYDLLRALLVLHEAGYAEDRRTGRARAVLAGRRGDDGRWRAGRRWWRPPGSASRSGVEAVDWGEVADQMVTLHALRVGAGTA